MHGRDTILHIPLYSYVDESVQKAGVPGILGCIEHHLAKKIAALK